MAEASYSLALAFDTDDPEFTRGVEIGRLWEQLRAEPDETVEQQVHATNAEMVLRMGEALDRPVRTSDDDGHWMTATFSPLRHNQGANDGVA
jgi:hypothetical protein